MSFRAHFTAEASDITLSGTDSNVVIPSSGLNTWRLGSHDAPANKTSISQSTTGTQNQIYQHGIWVSDAAPEPNAVFPETLQSGADFFFHKVYGRESATNANAFFVWKIGHLHYVGSGGDAPGNDAYDYHLLSSGNAPAMGGVTWSGWHVAAGELGTGAGDQHPWGGLSGGSSNVSELIKINETHTVEVNDRFVIEWGIQQQGTASGRTIEVEFGGEGDDPLSISGLDISYGTEVVVPLNYGEKHQDTLGHSDEVEVPWSNSGISFANVSSSRTWQSADWGDASRVFSRRGGTSAPASITQQAWYKQDADFLYITINNIIDGCIQDSDHGWLYFCGSENFKSSQVPEYDDYLFSIDINGKESQTTDPSAISEGGGVMTGPHIWRGAKGHPEANTFPYGWDAGIWHTGTGGHTPRGAEIRALDDDRVHVTFNAANQTLSGYTESGVTFWPYHHTETSMNIVSNTVQNSGTGKTSFVASGILRQDVATEIDWTVSGLAVSGACALLARIEDPTEVSNPTYYEAEWKATATSGLFNVFLEKNVAGSESILASGTVSGVQLTEVVRARFRVEDSGNTPILTLYWNGQTILQAEDTVSGITVSGYTGIEFYDAIGSIDNFRIGTPTNYKADFWEEGVDFRFASQTGGTSEAPDPNTLDVSTVGKSARTTFKFNKGKVRWGGRFADGTWNGVDPMGFIMNSNCDVQGQGNTIFPASLGNQLAKPAWAAPGWVYYDGDSKNAGGAFDSDLDLRPLMAGHLHGPAVFLEASGVTNGLATATSIMTVVSGVPGQVQLAGTSDSLATATSILTLDRNLTATSAGIATGTSVLTPDRNLIATSDGTSTASSVPMVEKTVTGTSAGTSTAASQPSVERGLTSSSTGAGTASATPSVDRRLNADSAGSSVASTALTPDRGLKSDSNGVATVNGILQTGAIIDLTATSDGQATATSVPSVDRRLNADSAGSSVASTALTPDRGLLSDSNGQASVTSTPSVDRNLIATSDGTSTVTSVPAIDRNLVATSDGTSTASSTLTPDRNLIATSDGTSTVTSTLTPERNLVSSSAGTSTANSIPSVDRRLNADSAGSSVSSTAMTPDRGLKSDSNGIATVTGLLATGAEVFMQGTSDATATASAIASLDLRLNADSSGAAAATTALTPDRGLLSDSNGIATASSDATIERNLNASSDGTATATSTLTPERNLSATSDATATATATPAIDRNLTSTSDATSTATSVPSVDRRLNADSAGSSVASTALTPDRGLKSDSNGVATATGIVSLFGEAILQGTVAATATASANMVADRRLNADSPGSSVASTAMTPDRGLNSDANGVATATSNLTVTVGGFEVDLVGASDGQASVNATLTPDRGLVATSSGAGAATSQAVLDLRLNADSSGSGVASTALTPDRGLKSDSNGQAVVNGTVRAQVGLVATSDGTSTVNSILTVVQQTLTGTSDGAATATASMSLDIALNASSSAFATVSATLAEEGGAWRQVLLSRGRIR